jgi:SulP family sulfate permease
VLDWGRTYNRDAFQNDMIAAVIVTIMLIPQSLAYALLAGLPPEAGLYASILPIILYASSAPPARWPWARSPSSR